MREQLAQYVELLFAGAVNCEDVKQEILQNTLDRYDDLVAQGKVPEAAYRIAITGIGDLSEILGESSGPAPMAAPQPQDEDASRKKRMQAIAIALYILCPVPVILLGFTDNDILAVIGVCGLFSMIAFATFLLITNSTKEDTDSASQETPLQRSIHSVISALGLVIYFVISFLTRAWYITWVIFPLMGAVRGLVNAIFDFMEASKYEN